MSHFEDVGAFMSTFGQEVNTTFTDPGIETIKLRLELISEEFKEVFKGIEKENSLYNSHLKSEHKEYILNQKEDLKKACLIAKKQDEKGIGMDMKVGESVGEYFDRKIQKSKVFMRIFNDINNNNFEQIFTK